MAMKHLYKIYPKRALRGIIPREISEPTVLEGLNRQEFLKCFNGGELYAIINDEEIHIKECSYEKAESLFESGVIKMPENTVTVTAPLMEENAVNKNERSYAPEIVEGLQHYSSNDAAVKATENTVTVESMVGEQAQETIEKDRETVEESANTIQDSSKETLVVTAENSNNVSEESTVANESSTTSTDSTNEKSDNTLQQPQQYNKNHNNQSDQSNYRNQKHGKNNKGKFVINN